MMQIAKGTPRRLPLSLSPCLLVSLSFLAAGCSWPGRPDPADRPIPENQVVRFESLFGQHCAGCHGANGKLGPAPPLNDPLFRAGMSEEDLGMIIDEGRSGTLMPAFAKKKGGPLTPAQIQVLAFEIKGIPYRVVRKPAGESVKIEVVRDAHGIAPKWGSPGPYPDGAPPLVVEEDEPRRSEADYARAKTVFARACAVCHGNQGQGVEKDGRLTKTINDPVFLALISDQALRRFVITGRPDFEITGRPYSGMPSYAGKRPSEPKFRPLSPQEVSDLVALLARWRRAGSPSGK
jgi:cytochrome c oxidase cbb3-type subunit 3/ubiquinol-cytochrome c reductase cytochrome c subunit